MTGRGPNPPSIRSGLVLCGVVFCVVVLLGLLLGSYEPSAESSDTVESETGPDWMQATTVQESQDRPAIPNSTHSAIQAILPYGSGAGQLGMVHNPEQEPLGPESFAIGSNGEVYIADGLNKRIAVHGQDGAYLRSIDVQDVVMGDVIPLSSGGLLVYDQVKYALVAYDAEGNLRGTLNLNASKINTRGFFHAAGDSIYFADAAVRDVLVATVKDGVLQAPDPGGERVFDGVHSDTGKLFAVLLQKGIAVRLNVRGPGRNREQRVYCPLPGVVSARFAGEDQAGAFYLQTERLEGEAIVLEVVAFAPSGERLAMTRIPENDYFLWTTKLIEVRKDGAIVQFLPQRGQAKLNIFGGGGLR